MCDIKRGSSCSTVEKSVWGVMGQGQNTQQLSVCNYKGQHNE